MSHQGEQMHRLLQAVEATTSRLAVDGQRLQRCRPGRGLPAQYRFRPPSQRILKGFGGQGDQNLADVAEIGGVRVKSSWCIRAMSWSSPPGAIAA